MEKEALERLKRVHYGMMSRCYNKNSTNYKNYGEKGVEVDTEWHSFTEFLKDVPYIDGWDESRYVKDKLALDKDTSWGNKIYSLSTCRFVTPEENNRVKPNQQYQIVAIDPDGAYYEFTSANGFAKKHNLETNTIIRCAKGEYIQHRGWQFKLKGATREFLKPYSWERWIIGLSPEGVKYRFWNASEFAREHGLLEATVIYACANMKNTHTRLWQFRYEDEVPDKPFLPKTKLKIVGKRGIPVKAIAPSGEIYEVTNRNTFAKEHNLSRNSILNVLRGEQDNHKGWKFEWK